MDEQSQRDLAVAYARIDAMAAKLLERGISPRDVEVYYRQRARAGARLQARAEFDERTG